MNPDKRREKKLAKRKTAKANERQSQQTGQSASKRPTAMSPGVARLQKMNLFDEVAHIIQCAQDGECRVVSLAELVLFSTTTGDAWLLDSQDNFATCLLLGGKPQKNRITETPTSYAVEWQMQYAIDGDEFVLADNRGQTFVLSGYPLSEIQQAIANHARLARELDLR